MTFITNKVISIFLIIYYFSNIISKEIPLFIYNNMIYLYMKLKLTNFDSQNGRNDQN
jgi:hypothetical protein